MNNYHVKVSILVKLKMNCSLITKMKNNLILKMILNLTVVLRLSWY